MKTKEFKMCNNSIYVISYNREERYWEAKCSDLGNSYTSSYSKYKTYSELYDTLVKHNDELIAYEKNKKEIKNVTQYSSDK